VPIESQVLGRPGRDNALWVRVDTGQSLHRLLFDCGENCLHRVDRTDLLALDHVFFSHFHLDHVAGFDGLFRRVYHRESKPVRVWGPPGTVELMHHRFRSFWWNLHEGQGGEWEVREVGPDGVRVAGRFYTREGYAKRHELDLPRPSRVGVIWEEEAFSVEAMLLEHHGPSAAYLVREPTRIHVRADRFDELGLEPGPWVGKLKAGDPGLEVTAKDGKTWTGDALREELLRESEGESVAYLTDFLLDGAAREPLVPWLRGVDTMVCESQYRHADLELAQRNCHATARSVAELARDAEVGRLVLMHLSERYSERDWRGMRKEARKVFPRTEFPRWWEIG